LRFVVPREVTEYRIALPNSAGTITRDETGRHMDQRGSLHPFRESDYVLRADYVGAEAAFECGVESDVTGGVDDDVDVVGNRLRFFFFVTEVGFGDVAAANDDLVVNKTLERTAVPLA